VWAKRKHLPRPLKLYASRLQDEHIRHSHYTLVAPRAVAIAVLVYILTHPFRRVPRFTPQGSASRYRKQQFNLTVNSYRL